MQSHRYSTDWQTGAIDFSKYALLTLFICPSVCLLLPPPLVCLFKQTSAFKCVCNCSRYTLHLSPLCHSSPSSSCPRFLCSFLSLLLDLIIIDMYALHFPSLPVCLSSSSSSTSCSRYLFGF
ncbi:hypothetical protein INR49_031363 [Caranx melampygus]|nr:hypothetical protein INR49_031363 [Caranx melampygus]